MVFYESTSFGLRVTIFDFLNTQDNSIRIRLIPMVHIGEAKFYKAVEEYLSECDLILYEVIKFKSGRLKLKNMQITANKLGLVTQNKALNLKQFSDRLIHADIDQESGKEAWSKLSIWDKIKFNYISPIYIYFQDRNLTRKKLLKYFMKSNEDLIKIFGPVLDEKETIRKFTYGTRENRVFEELDKIHNQPIKKNTTIGIIYGAGHMKAISTYIMEIYHYKVLKGEFVDVFKV